MSQYTTQLLSENIKTEAVIVKGDPRQIVLEYGEKYRPAAIVMGTRGLGLLKRWVLLILFLFTPSRYYGFSFSFFHN